MDRRNYYAALTTRAYASFASQEKNYRVLKKGFSVILLVLLDVHMCVITSISIYREK